MSLGLTVLATVFIGTAVLGAPVGLSMLAAGFAYLIATHQDVGLVVDQTMNGLYNSYLLLAATTLGGGLLAQLLMRPVRPSNTQARAGDGVTTRAAASSSPFWQLGVAVLAITAASIGLVSAFQSVMVERGIDERAATWFLSLLAFSVMVSRNGARERVKRCS